MTQGALVFGGIGKGIGQGIGGLVQLILEQQERKRQEQAAAGLWEMLAPFLEQGQDQPGQPGQGPIPGYRPPVQIPGVSTPGAPMPAPQPPLPWAPPPVSTPEAPRLALEQTSATPSRTQALHTATADGLRAGKYKPKTAQEAMALAQFIRLLQEPTREEERSKREEERRFAKQKELLGVEHEYRVGEKASEYGLKQEGLRNQAKGEALALGIPETALEGRSPEEILGYTDVTQRLRGQRGAGKAPALPEQVAANRRTLEKFAPSLEQNYGVTLSPEDIDLISQSSERTENFVGENILLTAFRAGEAVDAWERRVDLEVAKIKARGSPEEARDASAWQVFFRGAYNELDPAGQKKNSPADAVKFADTMLEQFRGKFPGEKNRFAAFDEIRQNLRSEAKGGKGATPFTGAAPVELRYTVPPILAGKGVTPEAWNTLLKEAAFMGLGAKDVIGELINSGQLRLTNEEIVQVVQDIEGF